jgi:putative transposase
MDKYKNKYRIASARADWWHYGWSGAYFITICTQNRKHFFGEIENGKMKLSNCGVLADVFWHQIKHHAQNISLGSFVVMPNHIHGILILNNDTIETRHTFSNNEQTISQNRFQNQGKNTVSSIIGSYKSAVTKHANRLQIEFGWQSLFYDHIIRNDTEYQRINDYIETNPENWDKDKFFPLE